MSTNFESIIIKTKWLPALWSQEALGPGASRAFRGSDWRRQMSVTTHHRWCWDVVPWFSGVSTLVVQRVQRDIWKDSNDSKIFCKWFKHFSQNKPLSLNWSEILHCLKKSMKTCILAGCSVLHTKFFLLNLFQIKKWTLPACDQNYVELMFEFCCHLSRVTQDPTRMFIHCNVMTELVKSRCDALIINAEFLQTLHRNTSIL